MELHKSNGMLSGIRPLIGILACHHRKYPQQQMRTWLNGCQLPVLWFRGMPAISAGASFVSLNCADDYQHLPEKVWLMCRWAKDHGYTHLYKTDDETYVRPERLVFSDLEYTGRVESGPDGRWANGGPGYILGPTALGIIAAADRPGIGAEDRWVAGVLAKNGIQPVHDSRFVLPEPGAIPPRPDNDKISYTGCCTLIDVPSMEEIHKAWQ